MLYNISRKNDFMKRRVIASDLDGTLLNSFSEIPKSTYDYLVHLKDEGHILAIASGRVLMSSLMITKGADFAKYIVSDTGALIYDKVNKRVVYEKSIPNDIVKELCDKYIKYCKRISLGTINNHMIYTNEDYQEHDYSKKIENINKFYKEHNSVFHISFKADNNVINDLYEDILFNYPDYEVYLMQDSYSDKKWVELVCKGVSKFNAIKHICEIEDISVEDAITFGDGMNDIDMIKNVGTGVAMNGALDIVKNGAKYVTSSNDHEGIKEFLINYLEK